jgi:predicted Holliday junction resolvase-like endonuclease
MIAIMASFVVGLVAGVIVTLVLMRRAAMTRAQGQFQTWRAEELRNIRRSALDAERSTLKERVGRELAAQMDPFPFVAADARFIGHPVEFVVFDGHTEVKDRSATALRGVVFFAVCESASEGSDAALVEECIADGRLSWLTLSMQSNT